jgi:iron complex outermembrane receptor protein
LGLNLNKTKYEFQDLYNPPENNTSAKRDFDPILLPSLDLVYTLAGNKSLYANISRGYSNPSLEETLTPTGTINPDIDQEKGINYEVGTKLLLADRKLSLKIAVYRMDIKNLLVAQRVGDDQYIGTNAGKTRHQGLEVEVDHRFKIGAHLAVDPFISYTLNDHSFVSFIDGDVDHSGNPLTGVPKNRVTSGLQIKHSSGLYWNTTHQYVDEIPMNDANSISNKAYTLFNTRVGYKKEILQNLNIGLVFGINNIGNVTYAPSILINAVGFGTAEPRYYYPGNPRNYYTGLQLRYGL